MIAASAPAEIYSKVKIKLASPKDLLRLQSRDVSVEHFQGDLRAGIIVVLNQAELGKLKELGMNYEILIHDLSDKNEKRLAPAASPSERRMEATGNVAGFGFGSMGGFYTYDEVVAKLEAMRARYPHLMTDKINIGTTHEGRVLWAVKVSDHPDLDEAATEPAIHYDALHHAREPISMAVLMYYLCWLFENYGSDAEATYLVDHREIYFVPVVNPDGYVYNQTTNPEGRGYWRKNRRNNGGNCFGVDLNRNYSYGYGLDSGSSANPCAETYRGPSAFSEPETQAVRDLIFLTNPKIAFSTHSVAGQYLNPYGYTDTAAVYEVYSGFASAFAAENDYLYGITYEMLGYFSSGTTRDYLHSLGAIAWTPEIGGSDFWPDTSEIFPLVRENLLPMKYLSWAGGAFADFQNYAVLGNGYIARGDTLLIAVAVNNRGLSQTAKEVRVELSSSGQNLTPIISAVDYGDIPARQMKSNAATPFKFFVAASAGFLDEIVLVVATSQEGVETARDTIALVVGKPKELFYDDAENGSANWSTSGSGLAWDTTFVDFYEGAHSFADSRYGNSANNTENYFRLKQTIDLTGALHPRVEFAAKWAIEKNFDYAGIQISVNGGASWTDLAGKYTVPISGRPSYTGNQYWAQEEINLEAYSGRRIDLRFHYVTNGFMPGDGFYFDRFRVVDYEDVPSAIRESESALPARFSLAQNYPNPFNPVTSIKYELAENAKVVLKIYNALGQEVRTLTDENQRAGSKVAFWDGKNDFGASVSPGIYIYRLRANDKIRTGKALLLR